MGLGLQWKYLYSLLFSPRLHALELKRRWRRQHAHLAFRWRNTMWSMMGGSWKINLFCKVGNAFELWSLFNNSKRITTPSNSSLWLFTMHEFWMNSFGLQIPAYTHAKLDTPNTICMYMHVTCNLIQGHPHVWSEKSKGSKRWTNMGMCLW